MRDNFSGSRLLEIFENAKFGPMRAAIFRYSYLYKIGGVYLDITKAITRPFDEIIKGRNGVILSYEARIDGSSNHAIEDLDQLVVQWCLISEPGHPLFRQVLDEIENKAKYFANKVFESPKEAILEFTAGKMLTRIIREYLRNHSNSGVLIEDVDYGERIYPLIYSARFSNIFRPHYASIKDQSILELH